MPTDDERFMQLALLHLPMGRRRASISRRCLKHLMAFWASDICAFPALLVVPDRSASVRTLRRRCNRRHKEGTGRCLGKKRRRKRKVWPYAYKRYKIDNIIDFILLLTIRSLVRRNCWEAQAVRQ